MKNAAKAIEVILVFCLAGLALGQTPEPPFSLTISVPRSIVKIGVHVRVDVAKKNISNQNIECANSPGVLGAGYDIVVTDSSGHQMPEGAFLRSKGAILGSQTQEGTTGTLKPGEAFHQYFDANLVRDMRRPGTYTIQISQTIYTGQSKAVVKSNTVKVTII